MDGGEPTVDLNGKEEAIKTKKMLRKFWGDTTTTMLHS